MHIQTYSDTFKKTLMEKKIRNLCNPGIFSTLALRLFQNERHIQNPDIFRILAYSQPCKTSAMVRFAKIVIYIYIYMYIYIKLFSQNRLLTFFLFYEKTIMNFFNIGLNFTLETFMLCKSMGTEGSGLEAVNFDIPLKTMYFFSFSTMSLRDA